MLLGLALTLYCSSVTVESFWEGNTEVEINSCADAVWWALGGDY